MAELYSPEEKLQLERSLTSIAGGMPRLRRDELILPFAASGGLFSQGAAPGFIELFTLQSRLAWRLHNREDDR